MRRKVSSRPQPFAGSKPRQEQAVQASARLSQSRTRRRCAPVRRSPRVWPRRHSNLDTLDFTNFFTNFRVARRNGASQAQRGEGLRPLRLYL
jgi:hypothetical protein